MRNQTLTKRLAAGLMSLVMLIALLPATTAPAAAAADDLVLTVSGTVNGSRSFTAQKNEMGENTHVVSIPAMYKGKQQTITVTASKPVKWQLQLGEQPTGMTLTSTGTEWTLSGSDFELGEQRFLLRAEPTDDSAPRSIWVYCYFFEESDRPAVTTNSLPNGNLGTDYYADLSFEGIYTGWAEWEVASGKLPDGLTLHYNLTSCYIDGTPTKEGSFTFGLQVTTVSGTSLTKTYTVTIEKERVAPALGDAILPYALVGQEYVGYDLNDLIQNDDYYPAAISDWEWHTGDALPAGLSIDAATGMLTGTVADDAEESTAYFSVSCTNGIFTVSNTLTLRTYHVPAIGESVAPQPEGVIAGEYFTWTPLTAADAGSIARWSAEGQPNGVFCDATTGGLYGKPTQDGTFDITFTRSIGGTTLTAAKSVTLTVAADRRFTLSQTGGYTFPNEKVTPGETTTSAPSKSFTVYGNGYSDVAITVTLGGEGAADFILDGTTSGTLGSGDNLTFSVKPRTGLAVGEYSATVTVSDTEDPTNKADFPVSFQVTDAYVRPSVTNYGGLPYAVKGRTYTYQFYAKGTQPYAWAIEDSEAHPKPEGMSIDANGLLTWVIPETWTKTSANFYVTADPNESTSNTSSKYCYINVYFPLEAKLYSPNFQTVYEGEIEDGRVVLPDGYVSGSYVYIGISTSSGIQSSDTILVEGVLPPGMSLNSQGNWASFGGTPTKAGTYDFTFVAQKHVSGALVSETRIPVRLTVYDALTKKDIAATVQMEVSKAITPIDLKHYVSGGKTPYTFEVNGTLPAGLTLENGVLSGTPARSTNGGINLYFKVTDANATSPGSIRCTYRIDLPPLELTDPLKGATFIDKISVGLSDDYKAKLSDDATYTLTYRCLQGTTTIVDSTTLTGKDSVIEIPADKLSSVKVGQSVRVSVYMRESGGTSTVTKDMYYTRVAAPTAPTANPGTNGATTTFFGSEYVTLAATTSGGAITIRYTTDGSDPTTSATAKNYVGTPIHITEDTVIKACCTASGTYSGVATFTYEKASGVTVSGRVKSPGAANDFTVRLLQGGTEKYKITGSGADASFSIPNVVPGTYDLEISRPAHLTGTVKGVVVGAANLDLTAHTNPAISTITLIAGDVNGDSNINLDDLNEIWKPANYLKSASDTGVNPLADVNGDGTINLDDLNEVWKPANYFKKTADCITNWN